MGWSTGTDLDGHRHMVAEYLAADPVECTSQATILMTLASGVRWSDTPPVFAVHHGPDGRVDATALTTPPHPLMLDGAADPVGLVEALGELPLPGVNAPEPAAAAFAAAWSARHGTDVEPDDRLHLLELSTLGALVDPPAPVDAQVRPAAPADLPVVVDLIAAMRAEIGERGESPVQIVRDRIDAGLLFVVERGGELVATANASVAVAGMSRVAGVYTVPTERGRGCAATVTAAVTRAAFVVGARQLCLFTDAANPTSNGVYERLGYRRRPHDRVVLRFR